MCHSQNIVLSLVVRAASQLLCMLLHESFTDINCIWPIRFFENLQTFRDLNKLESSNWNLWINCYYIKNRETNSRIYCRIHSTCHLFHKSDFFFSVGCFICISACALATCLMHSGIAFCNSLNFSNTFTESFVAHCTWHINNMLLSAAFANLLLMIETLDFHSSMQHVLVII